MSRLTITLIAVLALSLSANLSFSGETRPYKHPDLDLQFVAAQGWIHQPRFGDGGTHERIDPETGIHVLMWHTTTEQSAKSYLGKMASMMDLEPGAKPQNRPIDGRDAWVLHARGRVEDLPVQTILAVIPSGRSRKQPFEADLYIVQIWFPAAAGARLTARTKELLQSVRIRDRVIVDGSAYRLYPETTESPPDLPSPLTTDDGEVYVIVRTRDGRFGLVPVTVEDGAPNDYARGEWDKGRQLTAAEKDFPSLARTGLHAEEELDRTTAITGRPVAEITAMARQGGRSVSGFVAADEDVLGVIRGDNRLVTRLGLTHPRLARPLFEVFNLILRDLELFRRGRLPAYNIVSILYGKHEIRIEASASKGWQDSIFNDEVRGYWSIRIWRKPTFGEREYLRRRYVDLGEEHLAALGDALTSIQTGEMVPFYITRYGFYEGHTDYRADPIAIANLFGILNIEEIDAAADGSLYEALTRHYPAESVGSVTSEP